MRNLTPAEVGALIRDRKFLITLQQRCNSEGTIPAIQVALAREAKAAIAALAQAGDKGLKARLARVRLSGAFHAYMEAMNETVATYFPEEVSESGDS